MNVIDDKEDAMFSKGSKLKPCRRYKGNPKDGGESIKGEKSENTKIKCSRCHEQGHIIRKCKVKMVVVEGNSATKDSRHEEASNERARGHQ